MDIFEEKLLHCALNAPSRSTDSCETRGSLAMALKSVYNFADTLVPNHL
jgi:hypothetical protein